MDPLKGRQSVYYGSSDIPVTAKFCLPLYTLVTLQGFLRLTKDQFLEKEMSLMQHSSLMI